MTTIIESIKVILERAASVGDEVILHHKVTQPPDPSLGDFSSNLALVAAKALGKQPLELANTLRQQLKKETTFSEVSVAGPGFINLRLADRTVANALSAALSDRYGSSDRHKAKKARVEFISANPTGPLHIGNARGGPLGDTIANVLAANGYAVLREYIDNNRGNQVRELGASIIGKGTQYKGEYVRELVSKISENSEISKISPEEAGKQAVEIMFQEIMADCRAMGASFDHVVHESELQKEVPATLSELEAKGVLKKYDGAVWFSPNDDFLQDKDAVVVKSDGSYLYFTADTVYHKQKFQSGYDLVVDVFGANTSGHVPKLQALAKVYGFDLEKFKVVLYQFVRVKRGKEVVAMSKRAGSFVTAREVLDEVGKDAFRFFMLMSEPNTHMDFDLELAKKQSKDNPVYYVQYAVARIHSIFQKASRPADQPTSRPISGLELNNPKIRQLVLQLIRYPDLIAEIGETLEVHRLSHYAIKTASQFHDFYESVRVLGDEHEASRLALCSATLNVLEQCLRLMGISAPKKM